MARAVAAPRPDPPPVMTTATFLRSIVKFLLERFVPRLGFLSASSGQLFVLSVQHPTEDQRFHVADILAAYFVCARPEASRARHCVASEEQMIAGADQAGVEQHRIDRAEFPGLDAFGQQAAMEIQQRRHEELRYFFGGL